VNGIPHGIDPISVIGGDDSRGRRGSVAPSDPRKDAQDENRPSTPCHVISNLGQSLVKK
jgi:hypothetical protein